MSHPQRNSNPQPSANQLPQTHALDRSPTGTGTLCDVPRTNIHALSTFKDLQWSEKRRHFACYNCTGISEVDVVRSNRTAWHHVQEGGSVRSHRHQYFSFPSTFTFIACFVLFHSRSDFFLHQHQHQRSDQTYCTLLLVHSCHPRVSSSTSSSRGAIKLNPVTGSRCKTGSGDSSVGAVIRLREPGFDSLQGSDIFLCASRLALGPTQPNIKLIP